MRSLLDTLPPDYRAIIILKYWHTLSYQEIAETLEMTITVEFEGDGLPVTTLTGVVDQAALQSLLRRLYSLGLPLLSVNLMDAEE